MYIYIQQQLSNKAGDMDTNTENKSCEPIALAHVQDLLKARKLKALLVRSTDRYFNEYVPAYLSLRAKLTAFDGSVGDAIITNTGAHLFVDGRYRLQAKNQAKNFIIHVAENGQSIESLWLKELPNFLFADDILAYDPNTVDLNLFDKLHSQITLINGQLDPHGDRILHQLVNDNLRNKANVLQPTFKVDDTVSGKTTAEKLKDIKLALEANKIAAFLVVKLDDIAWITNLRNYYFPFQATIPGIAAVFHDKFYFGVQRGIDIPTSSLSKEVAIMPEDELIQTLANKLAGSPNSLGIDAAETSKAHELALRQLNIELKRVANPISVLKAIKNEKELLHLRSAFKKADQVVYQTQNFVVDCFEKGQALSEADVDRHIREGFKKSGAQELSFRPICAGGKNGAIIHYGTPDHQQTLQKNSLFLLDTGAYYEGGYATDLTRTFLAAKSSDHGEPWQRKVFTLVLKASIAGLSARFRRGALGMQLDAIVRAPLWRFGLDFAHGTGHGVGINVHEFPPRIGPSSLTPLLEGQVFSIEPGLYFENLGGVRIENLATIVADQEHPHFLRVLPLTFCPLDDRLIEEEMLDEFEESFLAYYRQEWKRDAPWPNLPPLPGSAF